MEKSKKSENLWNYCVEFRIFPQNTEKIQFLYLKESVKCIFTLAISTGMREKIKPASKKKAKEGKKLQ